MPDKLINIFFLVGNGTYWLHHIRGYWETDITACAYSQAFRKCNIKIFYFIPDKMALTKPVFFYLPKNPLKLFQKKKLYEAAHRVCILGPCVLYMICECTPIEQRPMFQCDDVIISVPSRQGAILKRLCHFFKTHTG